MVLDFITDSYEESDEFRALLEYDQSAPPHVEGIAPSSFALLICADYRKKKTTTVVLAPNPQRAQELAANCSALIDPDEVCTLPSWNVLPYEYVSPSDSIIRERLAAFHRIITNRPSIIITDTESMMRRIPSLEILSAKFLTCRAGEEIPFDEFTVMLRQYGYERVDRIESYGEYSIKGGIIDLFPTGSTSPVRLDFFGDTLESIREFDIDTQLSTERPQQVVIIPRKEITFDESQQTALISTFRTALIGGSRLPEQLQTHVSSGTLPEELHGAEEFFTLCMQSATIMDYITPGMHLIALDLSDISSKRESVEHTFHELYARKSRTEFCVPVDKLIDSETLKKFISRAAIFQTFSTTPKSLRFALKSLNSFQGRITALREEIDKRTNEGWQIVIATAFEGQQRRLTDMLKEFNPATESRTGNKVRILLSSYSAGIEIEATKTLLLTDHDIFGKSYRQKKSFRKKASRALTSFLDLQPGDYVVHINHGIGIFRKIERMSAGGFERDFLLLEYADGDRLFVALDQLNMVQKFVGADSATTPRIDSLGRKSAWNRIRERVQRSIEELAGELIEIYAKRKALKGFQYPPDTAWQEEFEANFEYEETPDQLSAIEDVKDDMESAQPMDRLICGDVGFGKTEVAIRAAFKAAMAGRQTAILVPTTVLAMQHFNTFRKRFTEYPFKIEMLSRFKSAAENKQTKARLSAGEVDIVVGTHALLAQDITFKNLGLVIIDEEQRFGVKHKEKLKKMRTQVDVLAMSATPIPRTLHMSMAGIRDLSIIMTPPENRQSIETFVLEENPDILQMAVRQELERKGQIFFVHNRVQTIDARAEMLHDLVPEASVAVAHGQMLEHELEEVLVDFIDGKYDILLATTIIESGIDMPHVNTIIIDRADTLGLSQLYQLKGRVGRSSLKAYAYFFYPHHVALNEIAEKRLRVLSEHTELGSGFKIAMKDLEIRGAGNVLGREQSGNIMDVGFDLYCRMLDDAVTRLKGDKNREYTRTALFLKTDIYIPESYIPDQKQKIEFYKRFESCETTEEIETLENEMRDRFGAYPDQVALLINLERVRAMASQFCIEEILEGERSIRIKPGQYCTIAPEKLIGLIKKDKRFVADPQNRDTIVFYPSFPEQEKKLEELKKWLQSME